MTSATDTTAIGQLVEALERSRRETIERVRSVVELRDDEAPGHVERVGRYCQLVAERLELGEDRAVEIALASTLHDAGKVALPEAILLHEGELSPHERKVMQQHTVVGHRLLAGTDSPLLETAAAIALTHHERFDGSGYPRQLAGEDIPLAGRIAAVADVFDALVTERPYRPAFDVDKAFEIVRSERGRHFDPRVLDAFLEANMEILPILHAQHTASPFANGNGAPPSTAN